MLPDLSITVATVPYSLPRISSEANAGSFSTPDAAMRLRVAHTYGPKLRRSLFRVDHSEFVADPLIPTQFLPTSASFWWSMVVPRNGTYSSAKQLALIKGFSTLMAASTDSVTNKWLGGEN